MFTFETVKINNLHIFTYKAIQCVPTSGYSSSFIRYAPFSIALGKLSLVKTSLNLGSFCISKFVKEYGGIKNFVLYP